MFQPGKRCQNIFERNKMLHEESWGLLEPVKCYDTLNFCQEFNLLWSHCPPPLTAKEQAVRGWKAFSTLRSMGLAGWAVEYGCSDELLHSTSSLPSRLHPELCTLDNCVLVSSIHNPTSPKWLGYYIGKIQRIYLFLVYYLGKMITYSILKF